MRTHLYLGAAMLLVLCASGCRIFTHDEELLSKSPLRPLQASPDSTTMEIIWVRFPADDPQLNGPAWQEIDETQIAPSIRRELANNGFRVGVIAGAPPGPISRALGQGKLSDQVVATPTGSQAVDLTTEPVVHGRVQQLRRNQRSEIQASEVYPSLPLLVNIGRELVGDIYQQGQAVYALRVDPQPDRTTIVELTPELHHGSPELRFTRDDDGTGILRQAPTRDREVFRRLRMSVKLAPGEMLVLMSFPDSRSLLGHYFHTVDAADGRQQKLILIRLADVPKSDTFAGLASH